MKRSFGKTLLLILPVLLSACDRDPGDLPLIGYVEAEWTYVAAPDNGWIVQQLTDPGIEIQIGDLLFRLDRESQNASLASASARLGEAEALARDLETGAREPEIKALESRLKQARAQLRRVTLEHDRVQPLAAAGMASRTLADTLSADASAAGANVEALQRDITVAKEAARPGQRDAARLRIEAAKADRAHANYQLNQRDIISAVDGRVEEVFLREGEFATRGTPVLAILRRDDLKVRFFVPPAQLAGLRVGQVVHIRADGLPSPVKATLSYIAVAAEFTPPVIYTRELRQKLVFAVDATLASTEDLHPGLPVEVEL